MFTVLVLFSAFLIESIGTYVSVLGLASLFSANPIIIALAIALDIGKVVSVSFLYKNWAKMNVVIKSYMCMAAVVLMMITSAGAFGFLSAEFQKAISGTSANTVMLKSIEEEQQRLQFRKEQIDKQIAQLPENSVRGRTQLIRQFDQEVSRINLRLATIDKELPALKVESIKKNVEVGPIMFISQAFDTSPEKAVKWVIFIIIFVFDPLAICLLLAGNFLIEQRKKEKEDSAKTQIYHEPSISELAHFNTATVVEQPTPEISSVQEKNEIKTELKKPRSKRIKKQEEEPSINVVIDTVSPPVKSSLEDIVTRNDSDVAIEMDEKHLSSQIRGMYGDRLSG